MILVVDLTSRQGIWVAFSNDATSLDDDFWDRKNLGGVNCSGLFTSYLTTSNVTVQKFGTSRGAVGPP